MENFKPKDLCKVVKNLFGSNASYETTWRTLVSVKTETELETDALFEQIATLLGNFEDTNPGVITHMERRDDGSFYRGLLCHGSAHTALTNCFPVVAIDVRYMRSIVKCWILPCYDMLCCSDWSEQGIKDC